MYIRVRFNGKVVTIPELSKTTQIEDLRQILAEHPDIGLPADKQRIIFRGKQIEDGHTLFDYSFNRNDLADVIEKVVVDPNDKSSSGSKHDVNVKPAKDEPRASSRRATAATQSTSSEQLRLSDIFDGDPTELGVEPECDKCHDNPRKKCGECGCVICRGKDRKAELLMCEECEYCYHLQCLDPPLDAVPEDDWYCPECRNDVNEIVAPGAKMAVSKKKAKMASQVNGKARNWGKGMATAGRTKSCTKVPPNHFGPIPGIEVGMSWKFRIQVSEEGVHRRHVGGIAGDTKVGANSVALSGGFEDDYDYGKDFLYTGSGGRDLSGNKRTAKKQSSDQQLTSMNLALAISCFAPVDAQNGGDARGNWMKGKPVRVVRTEKQKLSKYAPKEGCRYDGIYKVVRYWKEKGKDGFNVWRYLFRRDDPTPAPWTAEGRELIAKKGFKCIYPEGHNEAMAARKRDAKSENSAEEVPVKKSKAVVGYEIEHDIMVKMNQDKLNKKKWHELKTAYATKLDFTNAVEEAFRCQCCQEILFQPVTPPCLHSQCKACLQRAFKSEWRSCPICRVDLKDFEFEVNVELQAALLHIFPGYANERKN